MIIIQCKGGIKRRGDMKKILLVLGFIFFAVVISYADQEVEHHEFYHRFNPTGTKVYNSSLATSTGDQVAVNTYKQKSIQINPSNVAEYVVIDIEGRSMDVVDSPQWSILDRVEFGQASADTDKQRTIDVTEFVDFLRVGIKTLDTDGISYIDIDGLFTNLDR